MGAWKGSEHRGHANDGDSELICEVLGRQRLRRRAVTVDARGMVRGTNNKWWKGWKARRGRGEVGGICDEIEIERETWAVIEKFLYERGDMKDITPGVVV